MEPWLSVAVKTALRPSMPRKMEPLWSWPANERPAKLQLALVLPGSGSGHDVGPAACRGRRFGLAAAVAAAPLLLGLAPLAALAAPFGLEALLAIAVLVPIQAAVVALASLPGDSLRGGRTQQRAEQGADHGAPVAGTAEQAGQVVEAGRVHVGSLGMSAGRGPLLAPVGGQCRRGRLGRAAGPILGGGLGAVNRDMPGARP